MKNLIQQLCVASLVMLVVVGGCSRTQPSRFYVLTPLAVPAAQQAGTASHALALGLGPVELPQYVDRPQMLTRTGPNAFDLAEFDRWAEPLEENFSRVLMENLSVQLEADGIAVFAWNSTVAVAYRVAVSVTSLYRESNGTVTLDARWVVQGNTPATKHNVLFNQTLRFREQAETNDYDGSVSTMSRALEKLSTDIAAAVRTLPKHNPHP